MSPHNWIVYLSTFPPRECGIATFTQDLASAADALFAPGIAARIVAMNIDAVTRLNYPKSVFDRIDQANVSDYTRVAKELNQAPAVRLVNIQHEFGIFGGIWGENVLTFMETLTKPTITTFHSVLPKPEAKVKQVVMRIAARSFRVVVMTNRSKEILAVDYGIVKKKITVIPHGIHPTPFTDQGKAKRLLKLSGKTVLTTFGLLSRDKGIEYVIEALPAVVKKFPNVLYLVVGATHPIILRKDGEEYRNALVKKVYDLGLVDHVKFENRYLALPELLEFLKATDLYVATSVNPHQAVSGTFSYALGAGRPVVSTAFAQAKEDITPSVGLLVDFKKPSAYRDALMKLLKDPKLRAEMSRNAYEKTRNMTWPNVAIAYMKVMSAAVPSFAYAEKNLPRVNLAHLARLTDRFGMFQFANLAEPDLSSGYTVDDNARALVAACLASDKFKTPTSLKFIEIYLEFLRYTARPDGFFNNYVNHNRSFGAANATESMEDPTGRALYALAVAGTTMSLPAPLREKARRLFATSLGKSPRFTHLRAAAFFVKGLSLWLAPEQPGARDRIAAKELVEHCAILTRAFREHARDDWQWFEPQLAYANAILPDALISAYLLKRRERIEWLTVGQAALDFLISKTFFEDVYVPVGQGGWYPRGSRRAFYDQQPEDPSSMIQALKTMYLATKDDKYRKLMYRAFSWFLGDNIASQIMYDATTGGCYDGLGRRQVNLNQGAESTIAYLAARLTV